MIAGGNHTVIKKLLSVARLMRGGERLKSPQQYVEWGKLKQIPFIQLHFLTNLSPPLISQPCRFRSAVMADSFPPGEAKG